MKQLIFLSAIFLVLTSGRAQVSDYEIEWGELERVRDRNFGYIVGFDKHYFYTVGNGRMVGIFSSGKSFYVRKYDRDTYKLEYELFVDDFEYHDRDAVLTHTHLVDGQVELFFRVFQGKEDKKFLINRTVTKDGKLTKVKEIANMTSDRKSDGSFSFHYSKDSTKVLLFANYPYEKKEAEKFEVIVLDHEYLPLWDETFVLPYSDKAFSIIDKTITNDGEVYMIGYAEPDKKKGEKKVRGASNQDYKLFRLSEKSEVIDEVDLGLSDKYITSVDIKADFGEQTMAIAGFYSEEEFGSMSGSFYITMTQDDLKVITANSERFSKSFLTNFMSEKKVAKGRELSGFKFREFIRRSDGGAIVVAEQYWVSSVTTTDFNGRTTTTYYYNYHDIIILNINPEGKIDWSSVIPKKQVSTDDGGYFLGYLLLINNNKLHFIFNDHRDNLKRIASGEKLKGIGGRSKKTVTIIATVDAKGKISREELINPRKDAMGTVIPKLCVPVAKDEAILYAIKKRDSRFGSLRVH